MPKTDKPVPVTIDNFTRAETVRLYRPRAEILNDSWVFPEAKPVK
jgi:hypothetical protein